MPPTAPTRRPRIGMSMDNGTPNEKRPSLELCIDYSDSILRAGGLPILLPHTHDNDARREMIASIDGLLMPGGDDIDPALYGQSKHARTRMMDPLRQAFDFALLALAEQRNLPTLGICLGCQEMNIQRRGTLHQSIIEALPESKVSHHLPKPRDYGTHFHDIAVRPGTRLHEILGVDTLLANSRHRQGIAKLGHGLVATAYAPDGLIEGIEDPTLRFWIGVEWHPENMAGTLHERLFTALVAAAGTHA